MIDELGMIKPAIISCGGGMALRELNVRKLQPMKFTGKRNISLTKRKVN